MGHGPPQRPRLKGNPGSEEHPREHHRSGAVDTPIDADHRALLFEFEKYIPLGRIQVAEDLAGAVMFSGLGCQCLHHRQTLHVNGGLLMVD